MASTASMSALVLDGPGALRVREVPRPAAGRGEVLLQVDYCGICGTDLRIISGELPVPRLPLVIGHEFAGEVAAVGGGVSHVQVGQRAAADVILPCGTCHQCRRGRHTLCEATRELGIHESGGMAEYVVVPGRNIHPLPDTISSVAGALLEPIACAIHGQDRSQIGLGDSVVVIGGGSQGLLHVLLARLRGATHIVVIARGAGRQKRARELGADIVVDAEGPDPVGHALDATSGRGGDVVVEASGNLGGYRTALHLVAPGGRLLAYGATSPETRLLLSPFDVYEREISIVGSFGGTGDTWPRAVALIAGGQLDPGALVDAIWELSEAPAAVGELARNRGLIKGVIRVRGEDEAGGQSCGLSPRRRRSTMPL